MDPHHRPFSLLVAAVTLAAALPARADLPVPASVVAASLHEIARAPATPTAYARLLGLLPSLDALPPATQATWLDRLAAAPGAPLLAARARLERLSHLPDGASVAATASSLGLLDTWLVLGADPTADVAVAQRALLAAPTLPPAPAAPAPRDGPPRTWILVRGFGPPGAVSVEPWVLREAPTTVHLTTAVTTDRPHRAVLRLGATGDLAAALDGVPLGVVRGLGAPSLDQLEVALDLPPGRHHLLITLAASDAARVTLYARFTDRLGRPLPGLAPAPPAAPSGVTNAALHTDETLRYSSPLAALHRDAQHSPRAALDAAVLRRALGLPDDGDGSGLHGDLLEDLLLASPAAALPSGPRLLALTHVPREEARTSILLQWAAVGRDDPALRLALAQLAAERGQLVRARELAATAAPPPDAALLVRARIDRLDGLPETAFTTLLDPTGAAPVDAAERALVEAARGALELDRPDVAVLALARLAAALPGRVDHRAALAQAELAAGHVRAAVAGYAALAARRPDLHGYALEAARLAAVAGDPVSARALLDRVADHAHWTPDLLDACARHYEDLGDHPAAIAALERSLALRPASPDARAALERLRAAAPEPSPLTTTFTPALAALPPLDPAAPFEVLADEVITDVGADGSTSRHTARLLRVQRVPDARDDRTITITYDPSRELVRVLYARVHRGALAIANLTRHNRAIGESWYGLYYDQRELAIPFDDLRPGDVIAVAWRVDAVGQLFPGLFNALELIAPAFPTHRLIRTVRAPATLAVRARLDLPGGASPGPLVETHDRLPDGRDQLTVTGHDLRAIPREPFMPGLAEVAPTWQLTTFQSWADLAAWYGRLLDEQRIITPAMRAFTVDAVRRATGPTGVSRPRLEGLLADAVTRDVRYVALEFGVHGYKPYRTDHVWARRFGDCKDQATLLAALLTTAGSPAHVALVRTRGEGRLRDPLPSLALFDHAIVWLPDRSLYLDPTAASFGVGELPAADQGAQVLVIDAAATPGLTHRDRPDANGLSGGYSISLHADGAAGVQGTVTFRGTLAPTYRDLLLDPDSRNTQLERLLNGRYPGLRLGRATVSDPTDRSRPLSLAFDAEAPQVGQRVGATLQVPRPAGGDGQAERLAATSTRRQPLVLGPASRTETAFHYELPLGWGARELPPSGSADGPFGAWSVAWSQDLGVVHVETTLVLALDQISPTEYPAFRAFMQGFDAAVRPPLILVQTAAGPGRAVPAAPDRAPEALPAPLDRGPDRPSAGPEPLPGAVQQTPATSTAESP